MFGGETLVGVGLHGGTFTAATNAPSSSTIDE
jgi:hypothetical protein